MYYVDNVFIYKFNNLLMIRNLLLIYSKIILKINFNVWTL